MPKLLFVDDDAFPSHLYVRALRRANFEVVLSTTVDNALEELASTEFDAFVIDVMMPPGKAFTDLETQGGYKTGLALSRRIEDQCPNSPIIGLTQSTDPETVEWFTQSPRYRLAPRHEYSPNEFASFVSDLLSGREAKPHIFIVHGHDHEAALGLKNYLQNTLKFPEPTILAEQPSLGRTVIEKFESFANDSDIVFALFTPDDSTADDGKRARQNVVFEFGFFLGTLGRRSGRVFLLYTDGVELPSDLRGVIYIDITNGIESAGEIIRRELSSVFESS